MTRHFEQLLLQANNNNHGDNHSTYNKLLTVSNYSLINIVVYVLVVQRNYSINSIGDIMWLSEFVIKKTAHSLFNVV